MFAGTSEDRVAFSLNVNAARVLVVLGVLKPRLSGMAGGQKEIGDRGQNHSDMCRL